MKPEDFTRKATKLRTKRKILIKRQGIQTPQVLHKNFSEIIKTY
jgi:hypothetical protein